MHGLHCNLSKIHAVTCSNCRMIFFERALRISSNNDKVLGLVVYSWAKVLIVVVWPLSNTSVIATLKMAALHKNICGSQWLLIKLFILHKCSL